MADEIISRADAQAQGLKRYFTSKPCKAGHISARRVSSKACIACVNERSVKWRAENIELARSRTRESMRKFRERDPEGSRATVRKWYWSDPERAREFARQSYARHQNKKVQAKRAERAANPDAYRSANKRYYFKNPDKHRVWSRGYKARKRGAAGSHTVEDLQSILEAQSHRCAYCRTSLRTTKKHLDHIIPLAKGGSNDRSNLQFTCETCNVRKNAKDPIEFAQETGRLL